MNFMNYVIIINLKWLACFGVETWRFLAVGQAGLGWSPTLATFRLTTNIASLHKIAHEKVGTHLDSCLGVKPD